MILNNKPKGHDQIFFARLSIILSDLGVPHIKDRQFHRNI